MRNESGLSIRFKERVVAGGNLQIPGRDFDALYAPVFSFPTVFLLQILALLFKWFTKHIDFTTAFLNGDMDRTVYVGHPVNLPAY